jgi:hypothetical protein
VDEWVVDSMDDDVTWDSDTLTPGAGQTTISNIVVAGATTAGASSDEAGAASVTMSWTITTAGSPPPWAIIGVSLRPSSAEIVSRSRKLATQQRMVA